MPKIKFVREKKEIEVPAGTNLRKAAMDAGIELYPGVTKLLNCRGFGQCGECRVHIQSGMEETNSRTLIERGRMALAFFTIGHEDEVRLSCQTVVNGDIEVHTQPAFNWFGKAFAK